MKLEKLDACLLQLWEIIMEQTILDQPNPILSNNAYVVFAINKKKKD